MKCIKCGSENINVQMAQTGAKTKKRDMGCLWGLGRACLIFCTCGLWLLIGRRKGTDNTTIKNEKIALCQNCGHSWKI